ncbi:hypothetical protein KIPB_015566, partial [Kipferlia bialata]|eukprot:g15566.t1
MLLIIGAILLVCVLVGICVCVSNANEKKTEGVQPMDSVTTKTPVLSMGATPSAPSVSPPPTLTKAMLDSMSTQQLQMQLQMQQMQMQQLYGVGGSVGGGMSMPQSVMPM